MKSSYFCWVGDDAYQMASSVKLMLKEKIKRLIQFSHLISCGVSKTITLHKAVNLTMMYEHILRFQNRMSLFWIKGSDSSG